MLDAADKLVAALASAPEEGEGAGPSMAPAEPPPEQ